VIIRMEMSTPDSRNQRFITYPGALSQAVEAKLVCDLGGVHGVLMVA
jgi:hypothetical protein